ncbi:hypothetical protein LX90_007043 [Lentzea flava]|nr:hypothetical protein [Lentzea flava]
MGSRLCLLLMGPFALLMVCSCAPSDVAVVQCATPAQRARTVEGAISLGIVGKDSTPDRISVKNETMNFDEWRDRKPGEFTRACEAVAPVAPSPLLTQVISVLSSLGLLAVGVVATWTTTTWRDGINRRKQQAEALHKASRAFVGAVRDYCDARLRGTADHGPPPLQDVRHKRDDLAAQLVRVEAARPKWTAPAALRAELIGGPLGDDIETKWEIERSREERRPRADEVNKAVNELDRRIDVVVRALESPGRTRRELLREFPVGAAS